MQEVDSVALTIARAGTYKMLPDGLARVCLAVPSTAYRVIRPYLLPHKARVSWSPPGTPGAGQSLLRRSLPAGLRAASQVVLEADNIEAIPVRTPTDVLELLDVDYSPTEIVTAMIRDAMAIADGKVPDVDALRARLDEADDLA